MKAKVASLVKHESVPLEIRVRTGTLFQAALELAVPSIEVKR